MFTLREDIDEASTRIELTSILAQISDRVQTCSGDLQSAWDKNDRNGLIMAGVSIKYLYKAMDSAIKREDEVFRDDDRTDSNTSGTDATVAGTGSAGEPDHVSRGVIDGIDFTIHRVGSEVLRVPCEHVQIDTAALGTNGNDNGMQQVMLEAHAALKDFRQKNGFGRAIAAPQVGHSVQMIAIDMPDITKNVKSVTGGLSHRDSDTALFDTKPFSMFNPKIISKSEKTFTMWDDCLSFPDLMCCVERYESIDISFMDEYGGEHVWTGCNQVLSELIQHELNHLEGILAVDIAVNPNNTENGAYVDAIIKRSDWIDNRDKYNNMVDYSI